jgi:GMP synthase (glutamine-hydrolysing)
MARMKPFLILQLRQEDAAADSEFDAFLKFGGLEPHNVSRVRLEKESIPTKDISEFSAIIVGGGPSNVSDDDALKAAEQLRFEMEMYEILGMVTERDFPYLGACYGIGILAKHLGGEVSKHRYGETVGAVTVNLTDEAMDDPLTEGLPESFRAFAGHKEACQNIPEGVTLLAGSEACPVQMIRYKKNVYATQFHTELDKDGLALRIQIYRHAGYFPPEDAELLINSSQNEIVTEPEKILRRFVSRYASYV